MATQKQIVANKNNALKSTGPRTAAGKSNSRGNAFKHGLSAKHAIAPGESPEELAAFLRAGIDELEPVGLVERQLAERAMMLLWRLQRAPVFEARLLISHWSATPEKLADFWQGNSRFQKPPPTGPRLAHPDYFYEMGKRYLPKEDQERQREREEKADPPPSSIEPPPPSPQDWNLDALGSDELLKLKRYETATFRNLESTLKLLFILQSKRAA